MYVIVCLILCLKVGISLDKVNHFYINVMRDKHKANRLCMCILCARCSSV